MSELKGFFCFLGEQCPMIAKEIIEARTNIDELGKEAAKFSILCTKKDLIQEKKKKV
jgi:hypothetical protein